MSTMQPLRRYRLLAITVPPRILQGQVYISCSDYLWLCWDLAPSPNLGYRRWGSSTEGWIQGHRWSSVRYPTRHIICTCSNILCRNDLEWDGESKRIISVGEGRDKWTTVISSCLSHLLMRFTIRFGHAFMFDSGSSTGEIMGHNKVGSSLKCLILSSDLAPTGNQCRFNTTPKTIQGSNWRWRYYHCIPSRWERGMILLFL